MKKLEQDEACVEHDWISGTCWRCGHKQDAPFDGGDCWKDEDDTLSEL